MKLFLQVALIACVHVAFLFSTYASLSYFGLKVPAFLGIAVWIGASVVALEAYRAAFNKSSLWEAVSHRAFWCATCSTILMFASLYVGLFFAFNTFGT